MPSTSGQPPAEPPVFFTDQGLCRAIPRLLREAGWQIELFYDHFPDADRERIPDVEWLPYACDRGWAILMKDGRIRTRPTERTTAINCEARMFCLSKKDLPAAEGAARFIRCQEKIWEKAVRRAGPYFYSVTPSDIESRKLVY